MRTWHCLVKLACCGMAAMVFFTGCMGRDREEAGNSPSPRESAEDSEISGKEETIGKGAVGEPLPEEKVGEAAAAEPEMAEADWSGYFGGLNGAAVVYDAPAQKISIFNKELAMERRSPCSTFKIISSLIALEDGILEPDNSTRKWSGEAFWNEKWNQDIDFREAFRESCVWYFREVIDEIGQERIQEALEELKYGNCDSSDWQGEENTNNNNRSLTGFWIESSLAISPKEQAEVMERIFGESSIYSEEAREELKKVMLVEEPGEKGVSIYGKTGMGKSDGIVVDAWFTGFAELEEGNVYFCVYLGRTDQKEVSSAVAKEIAVRLVSDYCGAPASHGEES